MANGLAPKKMKTITDDPARMVPDVPGTTPGAGSRSPRIADDVHGRGENPFRRPGEQPVSAGTPAPEAVPAPPAPGEPETPYERFTPGAEPVREEADTVGTGQDLPGVSGRLNTLLDSDSPYLQRARARANEEMNRRGLLNSSIATGAAEASAIDAALPIAQGDANIAERERAMRSTEFIQTRDHRVQQMMQQRGLDQASAEKKADRELADLMQIRDHRVQQLMQGRGLSHEAAQRSADRQMSHTLGQLRSADEAAAREASIQIATQKTAVQIGSDYQTALDRIDNNPNMPPEERAEARKRAAIHRDEQFSMSQQLTGQSFEWTPYTPAELEEAA